MIRIPVERAGTGRRALLTWDLGKASADPRELTDGEFALLRAEFLRPHASIALDGPAAPELEYDGGTRVQVRGTATAEAFLFIVHHLPAAGFDPVWADYENPDNEGHG